MKYLIFLIGMILLSCTTAKKCAKYYPPSVERSFTTTIEYKDTTILGAMVQAPIMETITANDPPIIIVDSTDKVQLKYWRNKYGQILAACIMADVNVPKVSKTQTEKEVITITPPPIIKEVTPVWNWLLIGGMGIVIIYLLIRKLFII